MVYFLRCEFSRKTPRFFFRASFVRTTHEANHALARSRVLTQVAKVGRESANRRRRRTRAPHQLRWFRSSRGKEHFRSLPSFDRAVPRHPGREHETIAIELRRSWRFEAVAIASLPSTSRSIERKTRSRLPRATGRVVRSSGRVRFGLATRMTLVDLRGKRFR